MVVCSVDIDDTSHWFSSDRRCEASNTETVTTYTEPEGLQTVWTSDTEINLQWHSPQELNQIKSHYVRYEQV